MKEKIEQLVKETLTITYLDNVLELRKKQPNTHYNERPKTMKELIKPYKHKPKKKVK